jgi:tRNA pseudouridine38-40 synthase
MNVSTPTTYRFTIAYDGTNFSGWQIQPNGLSIQGSIQSALHTITHEEVHIVGAGRTDAGVHALGQTAHVRLTKPIAIDALQRSLNGILPPSIRVLDVAVAPNTFHAQRSATGKEYHYHICCTDVVLPFDRPYVWHCRYRLDLSRLREASACFVGTHDFKAFANAPGHNCGPKTSIRTIRRLDVILTKGGVRLEFEGTGFLYKMVRNIVGMMVAVATGKRPIEDIGVVFASKDRRHAERAAPAQGLFLVRVQY